MKKKILLSIIMIIVFSGIVLPAIVEKSEKVASAASAGSRSDLEQHILKSTVRFMVQSWVVRPDETGYDVDTTLGHGTVMNGRYLVTHNHFDVPLGILSREGDEGSYAVVFLYDSQGQPLYKGPLSEFQLAQKDVETLVFAHKDANFFQNLGFASAQIADGQSLPLEPGLKVAQVDWDGQTARVDWVQVQEVILDDGVPRLILDDGVTPGASGGGVFWQGLHVANNWHLWEKIDGSGMVVEAKSAVALNSAAVVDAEAAGDVLFD